MARERDLFEELYGDDDTSPRNGSTSADKIELDLVLHYDNEARQAVLVSETGEESRAVWLARSQIKITPSGKKVTATKKDGQRTTLPVISVSIPKWLAKDKGLI